jgi:glycyl-tRNA synthetase beta chain
MVDKQDLLIEIGTEELPPKALKRLSQAFEEALRSGLQQQALGFEAIRRFATPRRLALLASGLDTAQADQQTERKGPALQAAFDPDGTPTKAAVGFARSCGVTVRDLETQESSKGGWLVFRQVKQGHSAAELIPGLVEQALAALPIPKRMRWGERSEEFVRPVHWLVLMLGDQVIPGRVLGTDAGGSTRGHRFHHPDTLEIPSPAAYAELLRDRGKVVADLDQRKRMIRQQVEQIATSAGARALVDPDLLDEVTALVEWPVAILGRFDPRFLEVPAEALVKTMQEHQKYFPVVNGQGELQPNFIAIANIESREPEQVRAGNERVIRPRFSDAAFFWEQDLKQPLEAQISSLKTVVFQERLGSLHDKSQRIANLAREIADRLGMDPALAERAAKLCKCDLMTQMVGEFPSLQGTMGRHYAQAGGEPPQVVAAMEEHYLPRHAGDRLPQTACGQSLAIADRLDTLMGIFAIGQKPSGVKDPFGLRRAALGVLRILIETPLDLDLEQLLRSAAANLETRVSAGHVVPEVFDYMMDRLKAYYGDRGMAADLVDAVLAQRPTRPNDLDRRIKAVDEFRRLPEAASLAAANKRIRNILRKAQDEVPHRPVIELLRDRSEKELARLVSDHAERVAPLFRAGQYTEALTQLAQLREPVDRFFDEVMVMCDEPDLRRNRLALLASLEALFLGAADLSRLQ